MNKNGKKPVGQLELCPRCWRDSGERKESVNYPFRYYVRCASCGYTVSGDTQSVASAKWNRESRRMKDV